MKFPFSFRTPKKPNDRTTGQAMPEYATILALTTLFCIAALVYFGEGITQFLLQLGAMLMNLPIG